MMVQESESSFWVRCAAATPECRRAQRRLMLATIVWAVFYVAAALLLHRELVGGAASWIVALAPWAAGGLMIAAFVRFLQHADEFQRQVQLHAIGVGFAGTFLVLTGYPLLETVGAPAMDFNRVMMVMMLLYMAGILSSWWRYR